jgi:hypothetical protein
MQKSVVFIRQFLEALHFRLGEALLLCGRMLATVVALGAFFCLMMLGGLMMARHPEQIFQTQSFHFNYLDFNRIQPENKLKPDPVWDGVGAGFGLGVEVGHVIPIIGPVAGPVLGAVLGYKLDQKI